MEHDHVVTLFHEFGHLCTTCSPGGHEWARFSGVATEWDFVEAPSQMLEEWAWDADVLRTFATDADGEPIPRELVARMRAADEFGKGFARPHPDVLRRDVLLVPPGRPDDLTATAARAAGALRRCSATSPDTHFHAAFGHLEGYGSAYYTYMWSLVIAKDLFSAFDRDDLFATEVAHRYRDRVLAPGRLAATPPTWSPTSSAAPTPSTPSSTGSTRSDAARRRTADRGPAHLCKPPRQR